MEQERCPTCGASVISMFDHIDRDCEKWGNLKTYNIQVQGFPEFQLFAHSVPKAQWMAYRMYREAGNPKMKLLHFAKIIRVRLRN